VRIDCKKNETALEKRKIKQSSNWELMLKTSVFGDTQLHHVAGVQHKNRIKWHPKPSVAYKSIRSNKDTNGE
jgi:hypothetical protein